MEQLDLLRYVARVIEDLGLRYFVTGSTATIFYGEPRFTNDIDVVVELSEQRIVEFCRRFPQDEFYVSETAAREAVLRKSQFNIIHPASGLKVDVIVPEPSPFNESRFARVKRLHAAQDFDACFASPEDAIIKKMDYYRQGGSEKHLRDITGVLKTSRDQIDIAYITRWADRMGLGDLWTEIQGRMDRSA
ncbi:MAG: nucleotidyl transferase AbiEii/AbiGii toxin family protein [Tepidisphaeraceae bacterium]|jgi:hypothetical protein